MTNEIDRLLPILQSLPENHLTKNVIIPLLRVRGFENVEFFGGTNEEGKDIVFWERDKIGELKLLVAQVKHFKFSNKASGNDSFQTIINQLISCFARPLIAPDMSTHMPSSVFLITSFPIDVKTMQTRFSAHPSLINNNLTIIDGTKLANLLIQHTPEIVKELLGVEVEISKVIAPTLNNQLLLKALGYHGEKELKQIYTDIDFSLGKRSTELFFNSTFNPGRKVIKLNQTDWAMLKKTCLETRDEFPLLYFIKSLTEIEEEYKVTELAHENWNNALNKVNNSLRVEKEKSKKQRIIPQKLREKIGLLEKQQKELLKNEPSLLYSVTLDGNPLVEMIQGKRKWLEDRVRDFNKSSPGTAQLREFMEECSSIIDSASSLFSTHIIIGCINPDGNKTIRNDFESTRLKLSIDKVFDTGMNIMVLGEAGAGKSTSLQMYALNHLSNTDKLIIWVPLSRVMHYWLKTDPGNENNKFKLEEGIIAYLSSLDVSISPTEFDKILKTRKVVILLDAIDEVFNLSPWLIEGIKYFSEKYKKTVQVISTSRMSGSYVKDLPFFSVTLLPFTNAQRDQFINNWFSSGDKDIAVQIKKHLNANKSIGETIKNPLLTTTLCVLAEHKLQLPSTEIKLYDDRIKLLTGYYDNVKNITSRILTTPQMLEELSQKLAYYLHSKEIREDDLNVLKEQAVRLMSNKMSKDGAKKAFDELIDPCNILVPMSDDGKIGFGHLRFQEHLVAKEIFSNRSIDIFPLLQKEWWKSVLLMFCKMNDDLEWLIKEVALLSTISNIQQPLIELIKTRSNTEQIKLRQLLFHYLETEHLFRKLEMGNDLSQESEEYDI